MWKPDARLMTITSDMSIALNIGVDGGRKIIHSMRQRRRVMTDYQICLTVVAIVFYIAGFLMGRATK